MDLHAHLDDHVDAKCERTTTQAQAFQCEPNKKERFAIILFGFQEEAAEYWENLLVERTEDAVFCGESKKEFHE